MTKLLHIICAAVLLVTAGLWAQSAGQSDDTPETAEPVRLEDLNANKIEQLRKPPRISETETPDETPSVEGEPAEEISSVPPRGFLTAPGMSAASREEFRRLLNEEGAVPVTPPKGGLKDTRPPKKIPTDGSRVVDWVATVRFDREEDVFVASFPVRRAQDPIDGMDRVILPNRMLMAVEEAHKNNPDLVYRFSGETMVFGDEAYLLLSRAAVLEGETPKSIQESPRDADNQVEQEDQSSASGEGSERGTDELAERMLAERPGRRVTEKPLEAAATQLNAESIAPADKTAFAPKKKVMVVDRLVRIIEDEDGNWHEAHFEADNTLREPPMRVLPNFMLRVALGYGQQMGQSNPQLRVTGEITWYHGDRYLVLRKVLPERDLDRF